MDNQHLLFALISAIVGISCFVPYIRDIFLNKTTPHSYSWLVWAILEVTGAVAMFGGGAGFGIASLSIGAVLCAFVFFLSLRYGTKNVTKFDTVCLAGALFAFILYLLTHNALASVILVACIDLIAFLPTFRKVFAEPYTETLATYFLSALSSAFALGALSFFTLTTSLYLISLIFTNTFTVVLILIRRKYTRSHNIN
jgi:hypothetical protein